MVIALAAAAMLLSPAPLPVVLVTVLAIAAPPLALVVLLGWAAWSALARLRGRSTGDGEAGYLGALAAELRAGHGLRASLVAAAARTPDLDMRTTCRLATAGQPIECGYGALQAGLPTQGEAAAGAVRIASSTGARPPRSSIRWR